MCSDGLVPRELFRPLPLLLRLNLRHPSPRGLVPNNYRSLILRSIRLFARLLNPPLGSEAFGLTM
jgi:hypothetical protein